MAVGTFPPAWSETALITIKAHNSVAREFMSITETIDISEPDYPGESIVSLANGRIWKQGPEEDGEVTLELYPVSIADADSTSQGGLAQHFRGGTIDTSQALITDVSHIAGVSEVRPGFLVAILWTTDTNASDAVAIQNQSGADVSKRFHCRNARFISHKTSFTDGIMKVTATFKFPPRIPSGANKNWFWESSASVTNTTVFPALTYTTSSFDTATNMPS